MKVWIAGMTRVALALAVLGGGCAGMVKPRNSAPPHELGLLKERLLELQRQVTVHEVEIARLKSLVGGSMSLPPPVHPTPDSLPSYEPPSIEPVALAPASSSAIEDEDLPAAENRATIPAPREVSRPLPEGQQALYGLAMDLFRERRFEEAESAFRKLLERFPRTDLSDNASYWLGESLYARGEYQLAFDVFRQTVEDFPEGNKLPDALLKVGLCLERTGDRVGARDVLEEVIRRFPATAASATATAVLAGLR